MCAASDVKDRVALAHDIYDAETASPATRALADYIIAQVEQIERGDEGLRSGVDPIHDTRVSIRRLRSTLRVFGKLLDKSAIDGMDDELKWFAGLLGDVRDCHVQQRRLGEALNQIPDELVLGPVKARIRKDLRAAELPARTRVSEEMESARYRALIDVLRLWRAAPPIPGNDITVKALRKRARRAERKADRRLAAALESGDDDLLHRARKAAKRARYAAELRRALDKRAKRTAKRYKHIQNVLGEHQDAVIALAALRRLAVTAGTSSGENGFTYGMLYERERRIAQQCRADTQQLR
ncbi:hypothetical protein BST27_12340 [Mycobacterium intermedium]|uniref:CHAD domain-containing protein n=1 Tax=Mycobacterium intermedium TaxID=28445 RepID=A0A1E3SEL1_MYCIE|nr:CHAD domain-containing protein [Mycobacterium intermedium]MCV6965469.1 CHAD domain-containing protein [Mycobacterium intermedium]ODR00604.1 hypothetical protein BHQ20_12635 [Mycobacterium intermedium]OPE51523.1 hypothetical protein BV508_06225 [Mycobacterium intermedium]ORB05751.1 hypothetical protein BST27_12340 [Mycobacterium intermedium]